MDELSTLSVAAADAAASTARSAAEGMETVADHVVTALHAVGGWYGAARDGFGERVVELQQHLGTLAHVAVAGAVVVEEYARELAMHQTRLAGIDTEIDVLQRRIDAGIVDLAVWQQDWAELERWQASRARVLAGFDEVSEAFATRVFAVIDQVPGRPRRFGEHVDDAARTVAETVGDTAFAAAGWAWDAAGWTRAWAQVPTALATAVTHPLDTLADAVDWDDWSEGRWGAGTATLGMAAVGRLGKPLPAGHKWAKHLDSRGDPLPQSVDELLAGVDLERSEVFAPAHTLGRHVEVDDEFLKRRLATGEVENGVVLKFPPTRASRWLDQETAERVITDVLRLREDDVRRAIAAGQRRIEVVAPAPASSGVVWQRDADGGFERIPATSVKVFLMQAKDGSWLVQTAYLDA